MKKLFDIKGMWILGSVLLIFIACSQKKVPLDQQQFTALLIDMHVADGTLAQTKGILQRMKRKIMPIIILFSGNTGSIGQSLIPVCVIILPRQPFFRNCMTWSSIA